MYLYKKHTPPKELNNQRKILSVNKKTFVWAACYTSVLTRCPGLEN